MSGLFTSAMQVLPIFEEMQANGMPASRQALENLYVYLDNQCSEMVTNLSVNYFGGKPFNPESNPQTRSLLLRRGLVGDKRTEAGVMSTGKKSIEHYRFKDPAIELLFDWREHQHVRDSFVKKLLNEFDDDDPSDIQFLHSTFDPAKTETRRLSTKDPNFLNIPIRTDVGRMIRECFICPENLLMLGADYSQIEMRVLAHFSKSKFLIEKFNHGDDIHAETAIQVFGVRKEDLEGDGKFKYRIPAKTTNFGIIYGEQSYGLHDQLRMLGLEGWTLDRCDELIRDIIYLFDIEDYIKETIQKAKYFDWQSGKPRKYKGYIRDAGGMYRYLPNLFSKEPKLAAEAGRHAVSHEIQGTAQTIIQSAMASLRPVIHSMVDAGEYVKWLLQMHDELIFLTNEESVELLERVVVDYMVNHCGMRLRVPIVVDSHVGRKWSDLK